MMSMCFKRTLELKSQKWRELYCNKLLYFTNDTQSPPAHALIKPLGLNIPARLRLPRSIVCLATHIHFCISTVLTSSPSHKPISTRIFLASTRPPVFFPRPTHYCRKVHALNSRRSRLHVHTSGRNAAPFATRRRKARNIRTCRLPPSLSGSHLTWLLYCPVFRAASVCELVISPRIQRGNSPGWHDTNMRSIAWRRTPP